MTENTPIEQLTTKEKVQLMEKLWSELSQLDSGYEPPMWHGDVLTEREKALSGKKDDFTDWEQAKAEIRNRVS